MTEIKIKIRIKIRMKKKNMRGLTTPGGRLSLQELDNWNETIA